MNSGFVKKKIAMLKNEQEEVEACGEKEESNVKFKPKKENKTKQNLRQ